MEPVGQNFVTLGMPVGMHVGKVAEGAHRPKALQGKGGRGGDHPVHFPPCPNPLPDPPPGYPG